MKNLDETINELRSMMQQKFGDDWQHHGCLHVGLLHCDHEKFARMPPRTDVEFSVYATNWGETYLLDNAPTTDSLLVIARTKLELEASNVPEALATAESVM